MKKTLISALFLLVLMGCASNDVENQGKKNSQTVDEVTVNFSGPAFEDWRYKGFGKEIPLWFFFAYEDDIQGVIDSRDDLSGAALSELEIIAGDALNADHAEQLIKQNLEPEFGKVVDTFWAKLCDETEELENPYRWVVLIRR